MMSRKNACLAITLVNPQALNEAGSYLWCKDDDEHPGPHRSHCGLLWDTSDLVEPTENMVTWRTGNRIAVRKVRGRMLG